MGGCGGRRRRREGSRKYRFKGFCETEGTSVGGIEAQATASGILQSGVFPS